MVPILPTPSSSKLLPLPTDRLGQEQGRPPLFLFCFLDGAP